MLIHLQIAPQTFGNTQEMSNAVIIHLSDSTRMSAIDVKMFQVGLNHNWRMCIRKAEFGTDPELINRTRDIVG